MRDFSMFGLEKTPRRGQPTESFFERVYALVAEIPRGKVMTYGQIAMLCGKPRNSRQVGYGLRENLAGEGIPAFRVVNGRGELSGAQHFVISDLQRTLLAEDGVPTYWNGHCWRVDLKKYGWETSQADAAAFEKAFATPEDHLDLGL